MLIPKSVIMISSFLEMGNLGLPPSIASDMKQMTIRITTFIIFSWFTYKYSHEGKTVEKSQVNLEVNLENLGLTQFELVKIMRF